MTARLLLVSMKRPLLDIVMTEIIYSKLLKKVREILTDGKINESQSLVFVFISNLPSPTLISSRSRMRCPIIIEFHYRRHTSSAE